MAFKEVNVSFLLNLAVKKWQVKHTLETWAKRDFK